MSSQFIKKLTEKHVIASQESSHDIWGVGLSLEARIEKLRKISEFAGGSILSMSGLIDTNENLLSSLKRYSMEIQFQNRKFKTVGLGAVFTPPNGRGQGLAKILIEKVLQDEREAGTELALLFSDIDPKYYKQFGFMELPANNNSVLVELIPEAPSNLEFRQARSDEVQTLIKIYEDISPSDQVRVSTTPTLWSFFRILDRSPKEYIVSREGKDLGYFCISLENNKGEAFLKECSIPTKDLSAMFSLIKDFCGKENILQLNSWSNIVYSKDIQKKSYARTKEIPMLADLCDNTLFAQIPKENFCFGPIYHF